MHWESEIVEFVLWILLLHDFATILHVTAFEGTYKETINRQLSVRETFR